MPDLNYTITAMTERNFGDHGDICPSAHEPIEGETVEQMILRVLPELTRVYGRARETDHIVLRVTKESIDRIRESMKSADAMAPF